MYPLYHFIFSVLCNFIFNFKTYVISGKRKLKRSKTSGLFGAKNCFKNHIFGPQVKFLKIVKKPTIGLAYRCTCTLHIISKYCITNDCSFKVSKSLNLPLVCAWAIIMQTHIFREFLREIFSLNRLIILTSDLDRVVDKLRCLKSCNTVTLKALMPPDAVWSRVPVLGVSREISNSNRQNSNENTLLASGCKQNEAK